ncbi:MAG: NAD(P)H-dependent oxidoreductase subunit E [Firmicutes bacterium]|nr:NAD(P)H-dependent oxidoreductase subunit E [Bacillota bacterium]
MISEARRQKAMEIIRGFPQKSSAVIPLLHLWQDEEGYLSDDAIAEVAEIMGMPPAEVQEVVSFYSMFHRRPLGRYHIEVCRSLSCALMGGRDILDHLRRRLGVGLNEPTPDGLFSVGAVECLARCDLAPVGQVNLEYTDRLTPEGVDRLLADLRARAEGGGAGA